MASKIKNEVLIRVYILTGFIVLFALLIFGQTVNLAVYEQARWRSAGDSLYIFQRKIEAERGNILAKDGSLLATSLPFFDIAFDPTRPSDEVFARDLDTLCYLIATNIMDDYTPGGLRERFINARENNHQYIPLKRNVPFQVKHEIAQYPIFKLGRHRGGFIANQKFERQRPFNILARRTIGYVREEDNIRIGLEGRFNEILGGKAGLETMYRKPPKGGEKEPYYLPINDLSKVEPQSGNDIKTNIDIDIQDIVEESLFRGVNRHDADWGVGIVMEVETGKVRAIANLARTSKNEIWETYNHAVGSAVEPGSTFKIASMMSLLEDGYVTLEDSIDLHQGRFDFYEETMEDASYHQLDSTTVLHAFAISSNVGIAQLVQNNYGGSKRNGKKFIDNLKKFHLNQPTGIEIDGEDLPYIKEAYSNEDDWSGITLPWMSTGYELKLTPLQLLTFYNAIANNGQMMKPYLVSEVQRYGETTKKYPPTVIKKRIARESTIKTAQLLLESTVNIEGGTAYKYQTDKYRFAGKTGTSQIDYQKLKDRTNVGGYLASFAGYFPADKPKYSVIVMINDPKKGGYYGSQVALPIFREIADKIYQTKMDLHPAFNQGNRSYLAQNKLPDKNVGARNDMKVLLANLELSYRNTSNTNFAVVSAAKNDSLYLQSRRISKDRVPNVVGMGLRDALFVLENLGLKVEVVGFGKVTLQSIIPGTKVRGQTIKITLK